MSKLVRVKGKGQISLKPDIIHLDIKSEGVYPEYDISIEKSARKTMELRETIKSSGLNPDDLKTKYFKIDTKYESYRDKNDDYKKRFVGYSFRHDTYIKFPNDNKIQ